MWSTNVSPCSLVWAHQISKSSSKHKFPFYIYSNYHWHCVNDLIGYKKQKLADHLTVSTVKDCFTLVDLYQKSCHTTCQSHYSAGRFIFFIFSCQDFYITDLQCKAFTQHVLISKRLRRSITSDSQNNIYYHSKNKPHSIPATSILNF